MRAPSPEAARRVIMQESVKSMNHAMQTLQREVQERTPFRTGHLRRSIAFHVEGREDMIVGMLGTTLSYAPFLEYGTGLYGPLNHWIYPTHAKALRWPAGGSASLFRGGSRTSGSAGPGFTLAGRQRSGAAGANAGFIFAKRVRGIRPRRFFRDSAMIVQPKAEREFRAGGRRILTRLEELWRK